MHFKNFLDCNLILEDFVAWNWTFFPIDKQFCFFLLPDNKLTSFYTAAKVSEPPLFWHLVIPEHLIEAEINSF